MKLVIFSTIAALGLWMHVSAQFASTVVTPDRLRGKPGDSLTFTCNSTNPGGPLNRIVWLDPSKTEIVSNGIKYTLVNDNNILAGITSSKLTIKNGQIADNGEYFCNAYQGEALKQSGSGVLVIHKVPEVQILGNNVIKEGVEIQLSCEVDGNSTEPITWRYRGQDGIEVDIDADKDLDGDGTVDVTFDSDSRNLTVVGALHAVGTYTCVYYDGVVHEDFTESIVVGDQLNILSGDSVKFTEGEDATIECRIAGHPVPKVSWRDGKGNDIIIMEGKIANAKYNQSTTKTPATDNFNIFNLIVYNITMEDRQNFTCLADNGASTGEKIILLRVRDSLAALWPFLGICGEVLLLVFIILIHEKCSKGEDLGEVEEDEDEAMLVNKSQNTTNRGNKDKRKRGSNN